jgi:hypothetical protein
MEGGPMNAPMPPNTIRPTVATPVTMATDDVCVVMPLESVAAAQATWEPVVSSKLNVEVASYSFGCLKIKLFYARRYIPSPEWTK